MLSRSVTQSTPPDIVREFFRPFATRLKVFHDGTARQFPWHLGHICSSWRAVFLSMYREFWSEIQFDAWSSQESVEPYDEIARFFLQTGRNLPISFEFRDGNPFLTVLHALTTYPERWLDASFYSLQLIRLGRLEDRFPLLRSLAINNLEYHGIGDPDIFRNAPNLTRLSSNTMVISLLNFNWPSVTILELKITRFCSQRLLNVLSQMKTLEKLLVKEVVGIAPDEIRQDMPDVTVPRLKVLVIVGFVINLLLFIKTPVLEELYIDLISGLEWEDPPVNDVWSYFFKISPCDRLIRLTIHTYDQTFVKHVLNYTPHVQNFSVMVPDDERGMLYEDLTCSEGQEPLLPLMQELHTYCTGDVDLDTWCLNRLQAMIKSRTNPTHQCFKDLVFMFDEPGALMPVSCAVQPICESNHVRFRAEVFEKDTSLALSFLHGPLNCSWPSWM